MAVTRQARPGSVEPMKRQVSFFVLPVLVLAACGGGDDSSDSAAADDWCALAQQVEDSSDAYEVSLESGGETLGEAFEQFAALLDDAKRSAPDEIRDAVETSADGIAKFGELLGNVDYDVYALDESALAELEAMSEEMDTATTRIEAYNLRECGIDADAAAAEPDSAASTEPSVATDSGAAADPSSDWCVAAQAVEDAGNPLDEVDFTDPQAVEAAVTEIVGLFQAAADLAPPELEDDIALSIQAIKDLEAALREADWDLLEADLSMLEEDEQSIAAEDNINAYNERVCGIAIDDEGDDESSSFDPQGGTVRDQAIGELIANGFTEAEASCVFDNFDFSDPDASADPAVIMGVFESCSIDLARLAELGG